MISVARAQSHLLELVSPLPVEPVSISNASGRTLGKTVGSRIFQPPFDASAMDGYAIKRADCRQDAVLKLIGHAAAGTPFEGTLGAGEAVRIFTGGVVPDGADMVLIQENVGVNGDQIIISGADQSENFIRMKGQDFNPTNKIEAGQKICASTITLLASMGHAQIPCVRRPKVAVISTGDELVVPDNPLKPGQIYASNNFGLAAMILSAGAIPQILPIARDTETSLKGVFSMAMGADLIITSGGASVGDHDLVMPVAQSLGLRSYFHKVRMRPGKPLMAGQFDNGPAFVGLPGNPVSSLVCMQIFVAPMIRKMTGRTDLLPKFITAELLSDLKTNGPREHYMRGRIEFEAGRLQVKAFERQDSALTTVFAEANCLIQREPDALALQAGNLVPVLPL